MSAKELFEKLGYTQDINNLHYIGYIKLIENTKCKNRIFTFLKNQKYFSFIDDSYDACITFRRIRLE